MSLTALLLLLVAAVLHAGWNLLAKNAADRQATLWWGLLIAALLLSPSVVAAWPPPPEAVLLALAASVFELLYVLCLSSAYGVGDLSLVYPVARGSAPLLISIWAVLFLGEQPSPAGWAGILLCVVGLLAVSFPAEIGDLFDPRRRTRLALALALATGFCISGYTALNKVGLGFLPAAAYTALFHFGTAVLLTPLLLRGRGSRLLAPLSREPRRTLGVAALLCAASTLVSYVMSFEPASYVGAVREISVIVGTLAGWLWLGEPLGPRRSLAAAVMFGGMLLIALKG